MFIYVLKLEKEKYYVGITKNPHFRLENHFTGKGASWTKRYRPIKLIKIISNCDSFDEDKYTKIYMKKYGIDNVRGGSYVQHELNSSVRQHLEKELRQINNACFVCGSFNHWANHCNVNNHNSIRIVNDDEEDEEDDDEEDEEDDDEEDEDIWVCSFCGKEFDSEKGARYHEIRWCKYK